MRQMSVISRDPIFIGFLKLKGCQRDPQDRGVIVVFSLHPPYTNRLLGIPRKKRIESQFQDKRIVYCSRCNMASHNLKTCKKPLA